MEIRWYYKVIRRFWLWIILGTLITAGIAFGVSKLMAPTYKAQSEIVIYQSKADLTLDPRFQTVSEDELTRISGQDPRRQTMAALAASDQVLSETLAALPEQYRAEWSLSRLQDSISVDITGNLLKLSISAKNPQEAADVTNAWAEIFVHHTNQTFTQPSNEIESIRGQRDTAWSDYQQAEQALVEFLKTNQIDELTYQIQVKEEMLEGLQKTFQSSSQAGLASLQTNRDRIPIFINQAESLQAMLAQMPEGEPLDPSTLTALQILQANAFNAGQVLPAELQTGSSTQIQLAMPGNSGTQLSAGEAVSLVDTLITGLGNLQAKLDQAVQDQSLAQLSGSGPEQYSAQINDVHAQLDALKASQEEENARLHELTDKRDLTWTNYTLLSKKFSEVSIAAQTAESEVLLAAKAIAPERKSGPKVITNTAIGFSLGLVAMLAFAFVRAQLDDSFKPSG